MSGKESGDHSDVGPNGKTKPRPPPGGSGSEDPSGGNWDDLFGAQQPPFRIGRYKILDRLGEGGMGVVYLAEQTTPVRRRVALKLIKVGMDTKEVVARFEAERQALALMNHPNIAKVYDAGATSDGRPFFVMEYVPGIPITEHCDRHRLGTEERLHLFIQVCEAIQHAHQKAIIHRDIKPSNILVSIEDSHTTPKVIDFGVAKAVEHRLTEKTIFTQTGQMVGTPPYMSPEQAELTHQDIDTRTDIYSLGVLLYELLTGSLPFDLEMLFGAGYAEMQRIICEESPQKPSARISTMGMDSQLVAERRKTTLRVLLRQVRGDLDWVTMKAIEKDRTRRYSSATEFAQDVENYLQSEPVAAGPPSTLYRFGKLAKKYKTATAITIVLIVMSVCWILALSTALDRERAARNEIQAAEGKTKKALEIEQEAKAETTAALEKAKKATAEAKLASQQARQTLFKLFYERGERASDGGDLQRAAIFAALAMRYDDDSEARKLFRDATAKDSLSPLHRFRLAENETPWCIDYCASTNQFVVGHSAGLVSVIDADTGRQWRSERGPADGIYSISIGSDGNQLAASGAGRDIYLWDFKSGSETVLQSPETITCIRFHPVDYQILATGCSDGVTRIWTGRTLVREIRSDQGPVCSLAFSDMGLRLFAGYASGEIREHAMDEKAEEQETLIGKTQGAVYALAVNRTSRLLASGSEYGSIQLWPLTGGEARTIQQPTSHPVYSVAFHPLGATIVAASADSTLCAWDARTGEIQSRSEIHSNSVYAAVFAREARIVRPGNWLTNQPHTCLLSASADGWLCFWGRRFVGAKYPIGCRPVCINSPGTAIAAVLTKGVVKQIDAHSGVEIGEIRFNEQTLQLAIAYDPKRDDRLYIYSKGGLINVFDGKKPAGAIQTKVSSGSDLTVHPDGRLAALKSPEGVLSVIDLKTGETVFESREDEGTLTSLDFSRDGTHLLLTTSRGLLRVWKKDEEERRFDEVRELENISRRAKFGGEDEIVFVSLDGRTLNILDAEGIQSEVRRLKNDIYDIEVLETSDVVAASSQGGILFISTQTGEQVHFERLSTHRNCVFAKSHDETRLVFGNSQSVYSFDCVYLGLSSTDRLISGLEDRYRLKFDEVTLEIERVETGGEESPRKEYPTFREYQGSVMPLDEIPPGPPQGLSVEY